MDAEDVVAVLGRLESVGIAVWVDGGWGVDALVQRETRPHNDLDLAIAESDLAVAARVLSRDNFRHAADVEPGMPARFVLLDERGRKIDFHPLVFDADGNGWQQLSADARPPPAAGHGWGCYRVDGLGAVGRINGRLVRCLSPALQMRFHQGYGLHEADRHDMELLASTFDLPLPTQRPRQIRAPRASKDRR